MSAAEIKETDKLSIVVSKREIKDNYRTTLVADLDQSVVSDMICDSGEVFLKCL